MLRFTHLVTVTAVHHVTGLARALALDELHAWTPETVRQRFHYRTPGLYVLVVRTYRLPQPVGTAERPEYAGCKSWVELDTPVPTDGAEPVMGEGAFAEYVRWVERILS